MIEGVAVNLKTGAGDGYFIAIKGEYRPCEYLYPQ